MSVLTSRRVRYTAAAAGVTAIAIPIGMGLASTSSAASAPDEVAQAVATVSKAKVHVKKLPDRLLLNSGQIGDGWKTLNVNKIKNLVNKKLGTIDPAKIRSLLGDITITPTECTDLLKVPNLDSVTGVAFRAFQKGGSMFGPYAGTAVVKFTDAAAASAALNSARTVAAVCSDVTVSTKYGDANATVTPLSLPSVGAERLGYTIDANLAGLISAQAQVSAVREGKKIVIVGQAGLDVNKSLTRSMTRKAIGRL